jgi:hypothetical protein
MYKRTVVRDHNRRALLDSPRRKVLFSKERKTMISLAIPANSTDRTRKICRNILSRFQSLSLCNLNVDNAEQWHTPCIEI